MVNLTIFSCSPFFESIYLSLLYPSSFRLSLALQFYHAQIIFKVRNRNPNLHEFIFHLRDFC